jgi:hypothetical protein
VLQNFVPRKVFVLKREEVIADCGEIDKDDLRDFYVSPKIMRVIKSRRKRWAGRVACTWRNDVRIGL